MCFPHLDSLVYLDSHVPDILCIFVKLLRTIIVNKAQEWLDSMPEIKDLLATVLEINQRGKFPKEIRTRVLIMLCDVVLDHKLYNAYGQNIFNNWLATLPKLLCQPFVSPHVLKTFSHLARQMNPIFIKHLKENQDEINGKCSIVRILVKEKLISLFFTANLPQVQISGLENQTQGKQEIINLFFWLKT